MEEKIIMDFKDICKYLNASESLIRKLIWQGDLPIYRTGSKITCKKESLDNWIKLQELKHLNSHGNRNI